MKHYLKEEILKMSSIGNSLKYPEDFINKVICGDCLEIDKANPK